MSVEERLARLEGLVLELVRELRADRGDELLDERAVAALVGCSVAKLRSDRCKGRGLPYAKVNRLVRYRRADVEKALGDGRVAPAGGKPDYGRVR